MASPARNRQVGAKTELMALEWLIGIGADTTRVAKNGTSDLSDLQVHHGGLIIANEVKRVGKNSPWQPVKWLREAAVEAANVGTQYRGRKEVWPVVIARPYGVTDVSQWPLMMTASTLYQTIIPKL